VTAARQGDVRRGLTLLEVLLVLGVLVALAAIVWPATQRPLAGWRLRRAADVVRTAWTRARNRAISREQIVRFQYSPGGRQYLLVENVNPATAPAGDAIAQTPTAAGASADGTSGDTSGNTAMSDSQCVLPEGVTFLAGQTLAPTGDATSSADASGGSPADSGPLQSIFFYPDGSASTARVVLVNEFGRSIEIMLRGETGVTTVGELGTAEER
jgi:prepilin-type N-terminal cleavage/methylation domain-containing protein